jgi:hypothetical protein
LYENCTMDAKVKDANSHRFRDTFAVALLTPGVSLESVSQLLGHQSLNTVERRFRHTGTAACTFEVPDQKKCCGLSCLTERRPSATDLGRSIDTGCPVLA